MHGHRIAKARRRARDEGLGAQLTFDVADASMPLPFAESTFHAIFCNDAINHLPGRDLVLRVWCRVLCPGGEVRDATDAVERVALRWLEARAAHRAALTKQEGEDAFEDVHRFLTVAHALAAERRLSRFMDLASKPLSPSTARP